MASHLDERILGYQVDAYEVTAASRLASQGVRPYCHELHLAVQENISELFCSVKAVKAA